MIRENLDDIPEYELPDKYGIRMYSSGNEHDWVGVQSAADMYNKITLELFRKEFGYDAEVLAKRQLFLVNPQDEIIGTSTAWFNDNYNGELYGRIHWVAIHPDYQGRGLAKPLLSAACLLLKNLDHNKVYLTTSTARPAAISLYRKFGFVPELNNHHRLCHHQEQLL